VDALLERETAVRTGLVTEADWRTCADPTPLLHFLRDKGSIRKWRLFAVACCQRISHLMTDERSRRAVEIAAQYADGAAAEEELQAARSAAQEAQDDARAAEWRAEADANFGVTPAYAAACVHLRAASAARSAVCRDPRMADAEPGSPEASHWNPSHDGAAAAVNWNVLATFGSEQVDAAWRAAQSALGGEQQNAAWRAAQSAAESAETSELQAQCQLLRDLFAEYFGPPGEEGAWLTSGGAEGEHRPISPAERWCLLPTRRATTIRAEWLAWNDGTVRRIAQGIYEEGAFGRLPILADALLDAGCDDEELIAHCRQPGPHVRGCWAVDLILGKK
jgi:hypothetical protein